MTEPDWYPDPSGRFEVRYHDGTQWTAHVATAGLPSIDPVSDPDPQAAAAVSNPEPPPGLSTTPYPGEDPYHGGGPPPRGAQPAGSSGGSAGKILALVAGVAVVGVVVSAVIVFLGGDDDDNVDAGSTTSSTVAAGSDRADPDSANPDSANPDSANPDSADATSADPVSTDPGAAGSATLEDQQDGGTPATAVDPRTAIAEYGQDPEFDALADSCQGGDFQACDDLFLESPFNSGYEDYGDTCGGRNVAAGFCVGIYGS